MFNRVLLLSILLFFPCQIKCRSTAKSVTELKDLDPNFVEPHLRMKNKMEKQCQAALLSFVPSVHLLCKSWAKWTKQELSAQGFKFLNKSYFKTSRFCTCSLFDVMFLHVYAVLVFQLFLQLLRRLRPNWRGTEMSRIWQALLGLLVLLRFLRILGILHQATLSFQLQGDRCRRLWSLDSSRQSSPVTPSDHASCIARFPVHQLVGWHLFFARFANIVHFSERTCKGSKVQVDVQN